MSGPQQVLPEGIVWRARAYYSDFQVRGRRIRRKLSRNLTTARQLAIELRARAERGDVGLVDNDVSVKELQAAYLKARSQEAKPDTLLRYQYNLAAILPHIPRRV